MQPMTGITTGGATESFSYDGAGNIGLLTPASGTATKLGYDQAERLASVSNGGTTVAGYAYDAFGRRFSKTLPTSTSVFQYDQAGRLLEETNGQGAAKTDTVYLNGVPVASIAAGGGVSYLHTDGLGTPQIATNAAKTPDWGATYEPFGGLDGLPSGSITQNLRLPGQYADAETGFYQNGFRDYAPLWGRYLESDPIGLYGGTNTYAYLEANPIGHTDIFGLAKTDKWFGFDNRDFQWWVHNCYKESGDPDISSRDQMKDIYAEYVAAGSPPRGRCFNNPPPPPVSAPAPAPYCPPKGATKDAANLIMWYWIISEGSRLFLPRNAIPLP
jgi:RHS repeat-associated protein